ncbi:putative bifunctional protein gal10 [Amylocarpus encephaloides]|uniref:Bifunctional protein gal10 n=1 Tax=Amylocarpus encephaloides TaxID=45428 RepID=A0A9P7YK69_9HELO|nr:putative bifunctional protein gal10 [Amylocarpus encephaloides]
MTSPAPFQFLPLGAIIQTFFVGKTNIVQGFPKQADYVAHNGPFFGETIGRVANRVKNAKIDSLNNKSYALAANNGVNSLHGGVTGWGKRVWEGPKLVGVKSIDGLEGGKVGEGLEGGESVKFSLKSEDGDEGYPGEVDASVTYTTGTQKTESGKVVNVLGIEYEVELVGGAEETAVNVTNHSYFNLTGGPSIEGTVVTLCTNQYLPVNDGGIPTSTSTTAYPGVESSKPINLGPEEPDIDDCFIVSPPSASSIPLDTRRSPLTKLVTAYHPETKINFEVLSTEPAFQFYTGKYIDVPEVEGQVARGKRSGFCVEPSRYVNAVNVPEWRGQVLLKKGEKYASRVVYRGWSDE